jgi:hypothetical protein
MLSLIAIALSASTAAAVAKPDEGKCAATPFTLRKSPPVGGTESQKGGTVKVSASQSQQTLRSGSHASPVHGAASGESLKLAIKCKGTSAK